MRKVLLMLGMAAFAAAMVPADADARGGGARSGAARFAPSMQGPNWRFRLNRALAWQLRLRTRVPRRAR